MATVMDLDHKLHDEDGRLAALKRYQILDTPRESSFDKITSLVRTVLDMPICAVTLIDRQRQWFKSIQGLEAEETPREVAFCDHTIRSREPMIVDDALTDARFADNPFVTNEPSIRSYAGVPLTTPDGYNVGALCVVDTKPRQLTAAQLEILRNFASLVMDEIELRTIAHKDFLTGAATRRAFVDATNREIENAARTGHPATLVLFDIDHFKTINDRFGHAVGDQVLIQIVVTCEAGLRPNDLLGRVGGEEFALLLPGTDINNAKRVAERLRKDITGIVIREMGNEHITASFGIARVMPDSDFVSWSKAADDALYEAKRGGRNRTVVAH